jgi:hypothetical protein
MEKECERDWVGEEVSHEVSWLVDHCIALLGGAASPFRRSEKALSEGVLAPRVSIV